MDVTLSLATSLSEVPRAAWDACATDGDDGDADRDNPFVRHAFLHALEESGSATAETGWASAHMLAHDRQGRLVGAVPAYLKSHSRGEYVFDQGWAEAYARAGGRYYPKLQVSVPFTPATGPRLLMRADIDRAALRPLLAAGLKSVAEKLNTSSVHATFLTKRDSETFSEARYLERFDQQFHWFNESYANFDDFLNELASRKRKAIKRERRDALAADLVIERLTGNAITEAHWDAFYEFYMDTGSRKWGKPYLTREFYSMIGTSMADRILLVMAKRGGRYIAGAINFIGAKTLYGRHWGAIENHPFLHFEICYYQAMDFAIERGLSCVEAGAQGEHKLARGYRPVMTRSAHYLADPALRRAVDQYLEEERAYVERVGTILAEQLPFRRNAQSDLDIDD